MYKMESESYNYIQVLNYFENYIVYNITSWYITIKDRLLAHLIGIIFTY